MVNSKVLRRTVLGTAVAVVALSAGPLAAAPASADVAGCPGQVVSGCGAGGLSPISQLLGSLGSLGSVLGGAHGSCPATDDGCAGDMPSPPADETPGMADAHPEAGFAQVAAAPVHSTAPISQTVGSVGAPLVNVNIPCPAPWNQGGVAGADYNACNAAPVFQQEGPVSGAGAAGAGPSVGFAQVAAAPVHSTAPIHQVVGSVGAPLVNVNVPCPAPWQQGGVGNADYNACNAAPTFQNEGPVTGAAPGGAAAHHGAGFAQVAAAPVHSTAPIHQVVGSVGAPLVNVNVPCPAPWQQGGVAGSDYNACNAAPVFQQEGSVTGALLG